MSFAAASFRLSPAWRRAAASFFHILFGVNKAIQKSKKICAFLLLFVCFQGVLSGQAGRPPIISFEFVDQPVHDILYAFSTYSRISIIADDTVSGTASFQFNGTDFERAFDSFLFANRLYVEKQPDIWVVSRIQISVLNGRITLNTLDATPSQILEKLSRSLNATVIQDILPSTKLSLHLDTSSLREAVELVMRPFSDYTVEESNNYVAVRKLPAAAFSPSPSIS
ncbi:MAG: hypothetical protein LBI86_00930, partial [Treponema sp.]|nr:hypothetical protein [Treponema sp.]